MKMNLDQFSHTAADLGRLILAVLRNEDADQFIAIDALLSLAGYTAGSVGMTEQQFLDICRDFYRFAKGYNDQRAS